MNQPLNKDSLLHENKQDILISIQNVSKDYIRGSEQVSVLQSLNLEVPKGDYIALMGPSGSGKSTLLNLIAGFDRPSSGSIHINKCEINQMSDRKLSYWRSRSIGVVFQMYHLIPVLTTEQNVELPLLLTNLSRAQRKRKVDAALTLVGLNGRAKHKPSELSGGQEQRVGIARAIVHDPELLLCDEPTGDLDRKTGNDILDLLLVLNEETGKTIIMVTHDAHAADYAKRVLYVNNGQLADEPER